MIIEFLGISGVGKTTIARRMYEEMEEQKINITWPWNNLYSNKTWFVRNLLKAISIICQIAVNPFWCKELWEYLKTQDLEIKDFVKLFYNGSFLKWELSKSQRQDDISLYDEGVIQFIWAVHLRNDYPPNVEDVKKIMKMFGTPECVYVVDASAKTIFKRLIKRGESERILESGNVLDKINYMKEVQEQIIEIILDNSNNFNIQIKRIDNN